MITKMVWLYDSTNVQYSSKISIKSHSQTDNPTARTTKNDGDFDYVKTIPRIRFKMGGSLRYGK